MNAIHITETQPEPEWAREKQITAQFGLTHTILYNLRREGYIRTVSLRGKGKKYGARLYNLASIRSYLANQEAMSAIDSTSRESAVSSLNR